MLKIGMAIQQVLWALHCFTMFLPKTIPMKQPHFLMVFLLLLHPGFEGMAQSIRLEHKTNRLDGITNLALEEGILTFNTSGNLEGFVVLESEAPLLLKSTQNVVAMLSPGWDGTLGYKAYGLSLIMGEPGPVKVILQQVEPPGEPVGTSLEETKKFKTQLEERQSRFREGAETFSNWQNRYRDSLVQILMGGTLPEKVSGDVVIDYRQDYPNFQLYAITYQSQPDRRNTALLSIPKNVDNVPLLVALHGHETQWGKADSAAFRMGHVDDFCAYFARRGWAVLQPATMNHHLQHPGGTLQGEWTWDAMAALDICNSYASIDMERVAVCGLSTGGHLAMNLLALDDRIKAGVVGCILSTWNHYERRLRIPPHCDCGISHQLAPFMEQCDWAALAAPKPVQFQHGLQDASFCPGASESLLDLKWNTGILPPREYNAMFAEISRAYGIYQANKQLSNVYHEGPHSVNNNMAFEWLTDQLEDLKQVK